MALHGQLKPRWLPAWASAEDFAKAPPEVQQVMPAWGQVIAARRGDRDAQDAHDRQYNKKLGEIYEWMLRTGWKPEKAKREVRGLAAGGLYTLRRCREALVNRHRRPFHASLRRGAHRRYPRRRTRARTSRQGSRGDPDGDPDPGLAEHRGEPLA